MSYDKWSARVEFESTGIKFWSHFANNYECRIFRICTAHPSPNQPKTTPIRSGDGYHLLSSQHTWWLLIFVLSLFTFVCLINYQSSQTCTISTHHHFFYITHYHIYRIAHYQISTVYLSFYLLQPIIYSIFFILIDTFISKAITNLMSSFPLYSKMSYQLRNLSLNWKQIFKKII
jgi:hypothetical protein